MDIAANLYAWIKINWVFMLFLTAVAGAFFFLRSTPSNIDSANELSNILHNGKPTVVEFYSNF